MPMKKLEYSNAHEKSRFNSSRDSPYAIIEVNDNNVDNNCCLMTSGLACDQTWESFPFSSTGLTLTLK